MANLGRRIGAVYHDTLHRLRELIELEEQHNGAAGDDSFRAAVVALKEESIGKFNA